MKNRLKREDKFSYFSCFFQYKWHKDRAAFDSLPKKIRIKKDPLTPSKAAFYSCSSCLGQIHTRRYWIVPFIYGGLSTAGYFYINQNKEMKRYRNAYKQRIRGDFSTVLHENRTKQSTNRGDEFPQTTPTCLMWLVEVNEMVLDATCWGAFVAIQRRSRPFVQALF